MRVAIERHLTATRVNEVLNHAEVREWIAPGTEPVDISLAVADRNNYLLMGEHGGVMFFQIQHGIFECHTQVLPEGRGAWTSAMTSACVFWMFTHTSAFELVTRVPVPHAGARAAAVARGFRLEFVRPVECLFRGKKVDVELYNLPLGTWVATEESLSESGRLFHEQLHSEAQRLGIGAIAHEDDPNHNRYVGAAWEMAKNGRPDKGCSWYNRWAIMARHAPIILVNRDPVTIKIDHGMMLVLRGDKIEAARIC